MFFLVVFGIKCFFLYLIGYFIVVFCVVIGSYIIMVIDMRVDDCFGFIDYRDEVVVEKFLIDVEYVVGINIKFEGYIFNDDEYNVIFKIWVVVGVMVIFFVICLLLLLM